MKIDAAGSQEFFLPGGLLFAREKWVLAFGSEVLALLCCSPLLGGVRLIPTSPLGDEAPQAQLAAV